uniref:Zinc finger CCHC domain-containing protein 8 n=1 Tax=Neolamprologus brichardi TaxID=32507 RepID=A0A3Q4HPC2_NEOBR
MAWSMAEVDFGDSELFQQLDESAPPVTKHIRFTDDDEEQNERSELRSRLEECDDYIQRLTEENILVAVYVNTDGPLLQVLYTNNIISNVDKLGQPLVNENPQLTDGWDVPTYQQVFNQVIGTDGQEIEMKDKRPKSMCFNCGSSSHQLRDCPKPKDMAAINERRKEFNQSNNQAMQSNQRYHADEVEERFAKYKPGVMSEELLTALGIDENTLPPLIYRMRQLGYPPGWLKEAEMENSGLSLYDGNGNDGTGTDNTNSQNLSYDVSKLVDFPGFNVAAPHKMKDEFMHYGSIPMQSSHMKQNYAAYLSSFFPTLSCTKIHSQQSVDDFILFLLIDPGTPHQIHSSGDFQFQPPLPPGSPCFSSPPPLPQGTPPLTPTNGSPAVRGRDWVVVDETGEGTEDDLTLEELEEQQRLIWAALENADMASNSDCETPAAQTPVPSSPSVSTSAHADTETEDTDEGMDSIKPEEPSLSKENQPEWCLDNNLILNTSKIKEFIMDCRISRKTEQMPLLVYGEVVECVDNIKFLGLHLT